MTSGARQCSLIELCADFLTRLFARTTSTKGWNSLPKDTERTTSPSGDTSSPLPSPWPSFWLVCTMLHSCYSVRLWNDTNSHYSTINSCGLENFQSGTLWYKHNPSPASSSTIPNEGKKKAAGIPVIYHHHHSLILQVWSSCNSCSLCWKRAVLRTLSEMAKSQSLKTVFQFILHTALR